MAVSSQILAAFVLLGVVCSIHSASGEAPMSEKFMRSLDFLRSNGQLKEMSRTAASLRFDYLQNLTDYLDDRRRPRTKNDTSIDAGRCRDSIRYTYVPPNTVMKLKSEKKKGVYPNATTCGWWFWTDDEYEFDLFCDKVRFKKNDYMVIINEADENNPLTFEYSNVKYTDKTFSFGFTNDLVVAMASNEDTKVDKGFKCQITPRHVGPNSGCECGVPRTSGRRRSSGLTKEFAPRMYGSTAVTDEPWTAGLLESDTSTQVLCGAVIITEEWLLTSAACYGNSNLEYVGVGMTDSTDTSSYTRLKILDDVIHENFTMSSYTAYNNLVLLRVAPMVFNETVAPICLPNEDDTNTYAGASLSMSGWGTLSAADTSSPSDVLMGGSLVGLSNVDCEQAFSQTPLQNTIRDHMICASDPNGAVVPCHFDWGGPLTYQDTYYEILVGILSGTVACHLQMPYPDMYMRVSDPDILKWIDDNVGGGYCPRPTS